MDLQQRRVLNSRISARSRPWPLSTLVAPPRTRPAAASLLPAASARPLPLVGRSCASQARRVAMYAASGTVTSVDGQDSIEVLIDNSSDKECTVITVEGKDQGHMLMSLSGAFTTSGIEVVSATIANDDGKVLDVFRVKGADGKKLPETSFAAIRQQILAMVQGSSRSSKPAIYGIVAAAEVERLRPLTGAASQNEVQSLELAAAEMAQAAAELVAKEREILAMRSKGAEAKMVAAKEQQRAEASANLERKMAAMEAVLAARRTIMVEPTPEETKKPPSVAQMMEQMKPAAMQRGQAGPGCGTGYEILYQGFNWESCKARLYRNLMGQVKELAKTGITAIWLPPPSDSVSPQGYLPRDLYHLDSQYGTEAELRDLISVMHEHNIKAIADIVINHRCASHQGNDGKWNKFGGRLAWDSTAICCNNPAYGGRGNPKQGDDYTAAPNIDHTQERIRQDLAQWMKYLRNSIGFDGWRFDFVRGYKGEFAKIYIDATTPEMAFGEYWDSCDYTDGVLNYNQDNHRQRTVNWCDQTGGTAAAFDFTTKGILQEALQRREYWRLVDAQGRPPGVMGMWPSRAITFLDNHDTGSTLNHWPFPSRHLPEGYAYLITHPGTPTIFCDHYWQEQDGLRKAILELMALRMRHGINCRSKVVVRKAAGDVYAATVDDKVAVKIGPGDWSPNQAGLRPNGKEYKLACSGFQFAVWEVQQ